MTVPPLIHVGEGAKRELVEREEGGEKNREVMEKLMEKITNNQKEKQENEKAKNDTRSEEICDLF